jgi:putative ABC transport system permease protein
MPKFGKLFTPSPRWKKVLSDLWFNKTRTFLTLITIAVGVLAIGFVGNVRAIFEPDMQADFNSSNPSEARIYTDPFDGDLLHSILQVPGVADADMRSVTSGRIVLSPDNKVNIEVEGIPDPSQMRVNRFKPVNGAIPSLRDHQILLDNSASTLPIKTGDTIKIELGDGKIRQLVVAGFVHDVTTIAYNMANRVPAYATRDTIEWLGGPADFNELLIVVNGNKTDQTHVTNIANEVKHKLEKSGITVYETFIFKPGRHFAADQVIGVMVILDILGWMSVLLSGFLIINSIGTLMAQQVRYIGVMKTIGGMTHQILLMYLVLVMTMGLLALLLAAPLAAISAYQTAIFLGGFLNIQIGPFRIIPQALIVQAGVALGMPLLASLSPVITSTRISIRDAVTQYGLSQAKATRSLLDRIVERIRFLSRPLLLSLRNMFRRKGRLFMNLGTLTLAGAIFIAIFNMWGAMDVLLDQVKNYFLADITIGFYRSYRLEEIRNLAMSVPGVADIEGWGFRQAKLLSPNGANSTEIEINAPPGNSKSVSAVLTSGRWLRPDDKNALVIGNHLLKERPDLRVGDQVTIDIDDKQTYWQIVGIFKMGGNSTVPMVYTTKEYLDRLLGNVGRVSNLRVITTQHNPDSQKAIALALQDVFKKVHIEFSSSITGGEWVKIQKSSTDMIVYFMMVMAILIALVGALGLTGTMSMNVMERTREIGVMRAIGATTHSIQAIVIAEGMAITTISWLLAIGLSVPLTLILDQGVGLAMFNVPMDFMFGVNGLVIWLVCALLLACLASLLPAHRASHLTIRETLAYE